MAKEIKWTENIVIISSFIDKVRHFFLVKTLTKWS